MVIEGILNESRNHYQTQYDEVLARLLHIPKGSLRKQQRKGEAYWYLRRYIPGKGYKDVYIGRVGDREAEAFVSFVNERKRRISELKTIKEALRKLGVTKVELQEKGYHDMFLRLLEAFGKLGLWEEGLTLIGSWCFSIYVQAFGVEYYPLRTMDFDFGLRVPYTGAKADIDELLRNLGFTARIDMAYDKIDYVLPGVGIVEVFIDREMASEEQLRALKQDLALRPAALSYLHVLIEHPVTTKVHGVHKAITVPSMAAFFVHRLITSRFGEYRDPLDHRYKIRKDYKQAALVAKKILIDRKLQQQLTEINRNLSQDLRQKMCKSAATAEKYVKAPDLSAEDVLHIKRLVATLDCGQDADKKS